jgi:very-short-patch-repair endonuclease
MLTALLIVVGLALVVLVVLGIPWLVSRRDYARTTSVAKQGPATPNVHAAVQEPSPIERQFWAAYMLLSPPELAGLVPEYEVLGRRYRIDFALPARMIGIELDGHATHSSTQAIARDRQRQRALEAAGWRIIRFGGKEVHDDAAGCVRQAAEQVRIWSS